MEILGGPLFGVAGAGESHGPGITTIVFGCPAGLMVRRADVQAFLDRRRPGSNKHGTPRSEADKVLLLSGLYQDDTDALTAGPTLTVARTGTQSARPRPTRRATPRANPSPPWSSPRPRSPSTTPSLPDRPARCAPATRIWSSITNPRASWTSAAAGAAAIARPSAT